MKQYLITGVAGILALSVNIARAAPRNGSPWSAQAVQSKEDNKSHSKGHSKWNDRIEVRAQVRLQKLGYYKGRIDGDFGRASRVALLRFQRDKRLRATGSLDKLTIRSLGI